MAKRPTPTAEVLRDRQQPMTPAQTPLAWLAGEVAPRLGMNPEDAVSFFNSLLMDPSNPADVGMSVGPIGGVSKPIAKTLRVAYDRASSALPEGVLGRWVENMAQRTGGRVSGTATISKTAKQQLTKFGHPPAIAGEVARTTGAHEVAGHALIAKHFPFLTDRGTNDFGEAGRRMLVQELLSSMVQISKSKGQAPAYGVLGSFENVARRLSMMGELVPKGDVISNALIDPNRLSFRAVSDPLKTLREVIELTTLSPKQKEAVLNSEWVRTYTNRRPRPSNVSGRVPQPLMPRDEFMEFLERNLNPQPRGPVRPGAGK